MCLFRTSFKSPNVKLEGRSTGQVPVPRNARILCTDSKQGRQPTNFGEVRVAYHLFVRGSNVRVAEKKNAFFLLQRKSSLIRSISMSIPEI